MRPRDVARAAAILLRTFGARGVAQRAAYVARRRAGLYRASPAAMTRAVRDAVRAAPLPSRWPFAADGRAIAAATDAATAVDRAERVLAGEHHAYRARWVPRPGAPAEWNVHPRTGHRYPADAPWFRIATIDRAAGDIKDVWEPARFGWAYDLLRGWIVARDERYLEGLWRGVESFLDGCPPSRGVQWACGQETAIRAIAWLWLEGSAADAGPGTAARVARLREALVASADRVDDALEYALSQRNNHAISEAVALVALGARFRGVHPRAGRWLRRGRRTLEHLIADQIADDGWYIQHSFTYARVALDQLVIAQRVLRSVDEGLSERATARIRAAAALLAEVCDAETGDVPNHGANDGALVVPLSTAPYRDFRPVLTAAAITFAAPIPADIAPDREVAAWLGADHVPCAPTRAAARVASGASGWAHAVVPGARVFARAGSYRARPGHIDPLHVDVWIDGQPVAVDAGTWRYASEPWSTALASIESHNTLSLPGHPVSRRGPRFLWLGWPVARVGTAVLESPRRARIEMEHASWRELGVVHRRLVELSEGGVAVYDELLDAAGAGQDAIVHWLLDAPADAVSVVDDGQLRITHHRGDARGPGGWLSDHYGERRPVTSLAIRGATHRGRLRITTCFGAARTRARDRATQEMAAS